MPRSAKFNFSILVKGLTPLFILFFSMCFTTCDSPMGMGQPIDWEPPVLTLEPVPPNPMYVRLGTVLTGKVTDNIAVDRVIMREAGTGIELFKAKVTGDRWEIELAFDNSQNGQKIAAEVIAFDKMGNSGDASIKAVTLIIDIRPPFIEDLWIDRSNTRRVYFETYNDLKKLEIDDPRGENSEESLIGNRYQNGRFTIAGKVVEEETRIEVISLNIYDSRDPDILLLNIPLPEGVSTFTPSWLIKEEEIIAAGEAIWPGYSNTYYNSPNNIDGRYYYRVVINAIDRSNNESYVEGEEGRIIREEEGWFCMWERADEPKGILDPLVGTSVTKGATFPVEFFDDDQLLRAYTGLLTMAQWNGTAPVDNGVTIQGANDNAKLEWLRQRLTTGGVVYNWNYDIHFSALDDADKLNAVKIKNEVGDDASIDEKIVYLQTGNSDTDYGDYYLFTITADKKLAPQHNPDYTGEPATLRTRWKSRAWKVSVVDENKPVIVFDTVITTESGYNASKHYGSYLNEKIRLARTGDSPEESTFPILTDGQLFEINGYTLRANKTGEGVVDNEVLIFRMAWIPYSMPGGADSFVTDVQKALSEDYPNKFTGDLASVQHWDFIPTTVVVDNDGEVISMTPAAVEAGKERLYKGKSQEIGDSTFVKQVFRKEFNILGRVPDGKGYYHFKYNDVLENEQKLFVVYAEDNMGHIVYRQMRLLPNKKPPNLTVYDISSRISMVEDNKKFYLSGTDPLTNGYIPNMNDSQYLNNFPDYISDLWTYNKKDAVYSQLKGVSVDTANLGESEPYQTYTRGTTLKFWVNAAKSGDIAVDEITMKDISDGLPGHDVGSGYKDNDKALSFIEYYPDEATREFLFTATDTLGNKAELKRIISVTNTALLENITTTEQNGSYPIGKQIILQANFTGQVKVTGRPELRIRYPVVAGTAGAVAGTLPAEIGKYFIYKTIPCDTTIPEDSNYLNSTMFIRFTFAVDEGMDGRLETMRGGLGGITGDNSRPIHLPAGAAIEDPLRGRSAYIPGYSVLSSNHPNWTDDEKTLQGKKRIMLDGIRPTISSVTVDNKTAYATNPTTDYYYNGNETITLIFTSGETIKPSADFAPRLRYTIRLTNNSGPPTEITSENFIYARPSGNDSLVFTLPITNTPLDGEIISISLLPKSTTVGAIEDEVGNAVTDTRLNTIIANYLSGTRIFIKKAAPPAPVFQVDSVNYNVIIDPYYNFHPELTISPSSTANDQLRTWENTRQYSFNDGLEWVNAGVARSNWTALDDGQLLINGGTWVVSTRYVDRAGNTSPVSSKEIFVNASFPRLQAINADQSKGWHLKGENISFTLNFDGDVRIANTTVSITLRDRSSSADEKMRVVTATAGQVSTTEYSQSVTLYWNNISDKEMPNGLYVSNVTLTGLRDRFNNQGGTGSATFSGPVETGASNISLNGCPNLAPGFLIDAIKPSVTTYVPDKGTTGNPAAGAAGVATVTVSGSDYRNKITLTFREPVDKGSGIITIKPEANFLVPPVFENEGYYLDYVTDEKAVPNANNPGRTIWMPGFYDIYNSGLSVTNRNYLTEGTTVASQNQTVSYNSYTPIPSDALDTDNPSMSRLRLDRRTGQPVGPYVKTTHGLKEGLGYSGQYSGTHGTAIYYGPNTVTGSGTDTFPLYTAMIPDTSTKWVLAYRYGIHNTNSTSGSNAQYADTDGTLQEPSIAVVNNIRAALKAAKFRWQEIDVSAADVVVSTSTVTITLTEPLLKGLKWELSYPEGTFIDKAGNPADEIEANEYIFWSPGVRKPVIRVDRRSFDARTANWQRPRQSANNNTTDFVYAVPTDASGWGIGSFNNIAYRIESETPGATISYGITPRSSSTDANSGNNPTEPFNAVTAAWTGTVGGFTTGTGYTTTTWDYATTGNRNAYWVRPNLIRRLGTSSGNDASVRSIYWVNGNERRSAGDLKMLRSYNADATPSKLNNWNTFTSGTAGQGWYKSSVSFAGMEAGKRYVVARASITTNTAHTSTNGYEGVFRTLIALCNLSGTGRLGNTNQHAASRNRVLVEGSNIQSGMPSIAGFPVRDGAETGDSRFVKMMHNSDGEVNFYWVSTEIVSEWYFQYFGNGGNKMRTGDINSYMSVSYGDLTFGNRVDRFPDN